MNLLARSSLVLFCLPVLLRAGEPVDFNREIRPILSDRCFKCHGPDAKNQDSDFRLDTREHAIADLGGFVGISPGNLKKSELHHLIRSDDPDERMPPAKSKLNLSEEEKNLLERWIEEGAPYDTHWAFKPLPEEIAVPAGSEWVRSPIDAFILDAATKTKLKPSPEASREKWLRRVSFDLTGLPPTLAEIDGFLADTAEGAHARVVDRLLVTDAYAERMTSEWLDVARYSDSYGYQVDRDRFVWPYRDWVIRAFRNNLPYDEFIVEQLAGDLLPDPSRDQILATTFNRLHPQKVEGGSVPEEFRVEYVSDRLHTFGTAFLGLTLECCRCHDHKYDPISTREYYQLSSYFANIDEAGLYSYFTPAIPTPTLALGTPEQEKKLAAAEVAVAAAEQAVEEVGNASEEAFRTWLEAPGAFSWSGLQSHISFDGRKGDNLPDSVRADKPAKTKGNNRSVEGVEGMGLELTGDDVVRMSEAGRFNRAQPFSIALWVNSPTAFERAVILRRSKAWTDAASRGYELLVEDGCLSAALVHFDPGNSIRVRSREALAVDGWHHVVMSYDGSSSAGGLRLFVDGKPVDTEVVRDDLSRTIDGGGEPDLAIGERFRDNGFKGGKVDELRVFTRKLGDLEVAQLHDRGSYSKLLAEAVPTDGQRGRLREYFLSSHPPHVEALAALQAARNAKHKLEDGIKEIMVMRELDEARPCYVLERGGYDARGEEVAAATPAALPPFPRDLPNNRLGLAKWLTAPEHPLTSRVAVNRYWQMFFGNGLVRTPEDFGSQGRPPSHPQLLDWLSRDFIDHGWDLRQLIKTIVLSATYRQSTLTDARSRERDPENVFLMRGTTDRLSAEMIRDNALATSGLLVRKVGGPPAKPYELAVSFKPIAHDKGEGLYRRSLYTWWSRTAPAPVMMTLNASKRDVCRVRREVTNSPLQAFVLLNGPQFVEASRVLGVKLLAQHAGSPERLIAEACRTLISRHPTAGEAAILGTLFDEQLAHFEGHPEQASELLKTGETPASSDFPPYQQAATAVLVNAIMNLDEAVTKR